MPSQMPLRWWSSKRRTWRCYQHNIVRIQSSHSVTARCEFLVLFASKIYQSVTSGMTVSSINFSFTLLHFVSSNVKAHYLTWDDISHVKMFGHLPTWITTHDGNKHQWDKIYSQFWSRVPLHLPSEPLKKHIETHERNDGHYVRRWKSAEIQVLLSFPVH